MRKDNSLLLSLLKQTADISLYISVFSMLTALMRSTTPVLWQTALLLAVSALSFLLRNKSILRFIPFIFTPALFHAEIKIGNASNLVLLVPICVYLIVVNANKTYYSDAKSFSTLYKYAVWIVPVTGLIASGLSKSIGGDNCGAVFSVIFMLSGMVLMRFSRHSSSLVRDSYFSLVNALAVASVIALCLVISVATYGTGKLAGMGIDALLALDNSSKFYGPQYKDKEIKEEDELPTVYQNDLDIDTYNEGPLENIEGNIYIGFAAGILAIAAICALILTRRGKSRHIGWIARNSESKYSETAPKNGKPQKISTGNRNVIRRCFKKFITLCKKRYITVDASSTSQEICNAAKEVGFSASECDMLRRIYTLARYSDAPITAEDAKNATRLYQIIKASKQLQK